MENENWKAIPGFEGQYEVSDKGRVKSLARTVTQSDGAHRKLKGRILKPGANRSGHMHVALCRGGEATARYVHRLVLSAFIGPCPDGFEACHNDGDPANNRLDNLRWDTRSGNTLDRVKHGTDHQARKSHCPHGHIHFEENNIPSHAKRGWRSCLICSRARDYIRHNNIPSHQHWMVRDMFLEEFLLEMEEV